ncbi:MAG TPA: CoA transferase [Chloroflexia bacterium]|nr:CoA transferase [Chloroflexia bacterium]
MADPADPAPQPLAGLRVLDCSRVLAGPFCTMLLGDLGADVVKVEHPVGGDETRHWGPPTAGGEAAYYLSINRNKRSLALDLKTPAGQATLRRLAARADVLVENFRRGTMAAWGLDYAALRAANPGLIYCTISGYGPLGPAAAHPGYDFAIQAASGLMGITGEPAGAPMKVGVAIVDLLTGLFAANAIQAALLGRERGRATPPIGAHVEVSLFESALAALINVGQNVLVTGRDAGRYGNAHANIVPYQLFAAADGWLALAVGNDRQFAALAHTLGHPEWPADPRRATNPARLADRDRLIAELDAIFATRSVADWRDRLETADIPVAAVQTVAAALESPQARALGIVQDIVHPTAGPIRLVGAPLRFDGRLPPIRRPPPLLGEHSAEILAELAAAGLVVG